MLIKDAVKHVTKRFDLSLADSVVTKDASGTVTIQGYANTSSKDRVGDVVNPMAFEKSLPTYMTNPVLLANHDWEDPIGVVTDAKITDKGLFIKATISNSREDIKTLIREKCLRTFSIGYNEIDADYDESTKTKYVKELELLEISVVTVPANAEAMFSVEETKQESSAPEAKPEKSAFVTRMKEFVGEVEKTLARKMNGSEVGAVCGYFIENKGDDMTTKELIAKLKEKSLPAPVAEAAKKDDATPAAAGENQPSAGADPIAELSAKIDTLCAAVAKIMESMQADAQADKPAEPAKPAKPAEAPPAEGDKPADDGKAAADAAAPADDKEGDDEEMTDEEKAAIEGEIAELTSEIEALEDRL